MQEAESARCARRDGGSRQLDRMRVRGHLVTGLGQGAFFTGLDWVVAGIQEVVGWRPYPGTLNVRVVEEDRPLLAEMFAEKDFDLVSPDPRYCNASAKRIFVDAVPGIAIFPSEEVRLHGQEIIEIIADCSLREKLGIKPGDLVEIASSLAR